MSNSDDVPHVGNEAVFPKVTGQPSAALVRQFVEHWGMMARSWGINPTMGELFAILYITGEDWTADDLRQRLEVSRGNVSMNLRELMSWGVVQKVHRQGERREYFRAESDVWTLFRRILAERKRRELDPTLAVLERLNEEIASEPSLLSYRPAIEAMGAFFQTLHAIAIQVDGMTPQQLTELSAVFRTPTDSDNHDSNADCDS